VRGSLAFLVLGPSWSIGNCSGGDDRLEDAVSWHRHGRVVRE
jgi:hypothetical protein